MKNYVLMAGRYTHFALEVEDGFVTDVALKVRFETEIKNILSPGLALIRFNLTPGSKMQARMQEKMIRKPISEAITCFSEKVWKLNEEITETDFNSYKNQWSATKPGR